MRLVAFVGLLATLASAAPEDPLPLANPGFEDGLVGWEVLDQGMSTLSSEQAASGRASLKVVDASEQLGSDAVATALPIEGGEGYVLRGKAYPLQGEGLGIYVRLLDENRKLIGRGDEFQRGAPSRPVGQWVPFEVPVFAPPNARYLQLWIHSYAKARVTAHLDDFAVIKPLPTPPPWTPQYKLRPDETARLTAADVVGPDGLVY
ncbi:MAG: hypothetical protein HUU35_05830, partial [Armatimonadetes bacterium]|nr:hypothetical protein [Armatimonadota bacterium]